MDDVEIEEGVRLEEVRTLFYYKTNKVIWLASHHLRRYETHHPGFRLS
jgi:hypothetical protein